MARIIYAEDDEIPGNIVSDALIDAGHAVGWVTDGHEALRAMLFRPPHLAILDWDMPVMTGTMVLREMRTSPLLAGIPMMMLTAKGAQGDRDIAFYDGADDYLAKPFDPEELVFRLQALLSGAKRRTVVGPETLGSIRRSA